MSDVVRPGQSTVAELPFACSGVAVLPVIDVVATAPPPAKTLSSVPVRNITQYMAAIFKI